MSPGAALPGSIIVAVDLLASKATWNDSCGLQEARVPTFLTEYGRDEMALEIAASAAEEISMFRRFNDACGYAIFIAARCRSSAIHEVCRPPTPRKPSSGSDT